MVSRWTFSRFWFIQIKLVPCWSVGQDSTAYLILYTELWFLHLHWTTKPRKDIWQKFNLEIKVYSSLIYSVLYFQLSFWLACSSIHYWIVKLLTPHEILCPVFHTKNRKKKVAGEKNNRKRYELWNFGWGVFKVGRSLKRQEGQELSAFWWPRCSHMGFFPIEANKHLIEEAQKAFLLGY